MINYYYHKEMFEKKRMEAYSVPHESLKEIDQGGGRFWKPLDGHNYLYFREVGEMFDSDHTNDFLVPKENTIDKVYSQMKELLSLKANFQEYSEEELINFCKETLAGFKVPKKIEFCELPKTSTGKIQKFELRKKAKE